VNAPFSIHDMLCREQFLAFAIYAFSFVYPGRRMALSVAVLATATGIDRVLHGESRRLLITVPPRSGKSLLASIALPAFCLGKDPRSRIIAASYSADLAAKLARDCRLVMRHESYRRFFPDTTLAGKNTEMELETSQGGFRFATSVGGTLTGRGGNLIVVDDPMKPDEAASRASRDKVLEWFRATVQSRLDDKSADKIIVVMQRLHEDDLAGHLIEMGGWNHICLPAIAEHDEHVDIGGGRTLLRKAGSLLDTTREPLEVLDELKRNLGTAAFQAQYQQRPVPAEGTMIKREWLRTYSRLPPLAPTDLIVHSWDTAQKTAAQNDYSVGTIWRLSGPDAYLLNVVRGRFDFPTLKHKVRQQFYEQKPRTILIEDTGVGTALAQELHRERLPIIAMPLLGLDKISRMSVQSVKIEQGRLFLPERAAWLGDFVSELLAFPNGRHDDQVDTVSQLFAWMDRRRSNVLVGTYGPT
jgi:predicted phage terminase large subunit-like protein